MNASLNSYALYGMLQAVGWTALAIAAVVLWVVL